MKRLNVLGLVSIFALLAYVIAPKVHADVRDSDQWDMKTAVTFQHPVEVPGEVLPAGTYIFTTLAPYDNPQIVRIFNRDETRVVGTFTTVPAYAIRPHATTVITFDERPGGRPAAIDTWWYPQELIGHQFIYR